MEHRLGLLGLRSPQSLLWGLQATNRRGPRAPIPPAPGEHISGWPLWGTEGRSQPHVTHTPPRGPEQGQGSWEEARRARTTPTDTARQ